MSEVNYWEEMRRIREQEKLIEGEDGAWHSWLRREDHPCLFLYGHSHGYLTIRVWARGDTFHAGLYISSIDDSSAALHGPDESEEKARTRMARLLEHARAWDGAIPTREAFEKVAHETGTYADYN